MTYDVFIHPKSCSEYMKEELNGKVYDLLCKDFCECFENKEEISSIFDIVYWHCSRIMYEEEPCHDYYNRYFHPECKYEDMYAVSFYQYEYTELIVYSIYIIISMQRHIDNRLSHLLNRIEDDERYGKRVQEIKPEVTRLKKDGNCYSTDFTANIKRKKQESLIHSILLDDSENGYHATRSVIDGFFGGDIKYAQQIVSLLESDLQKRVVERISQLLEHYHLVQNTPLAYQYDGLHYDVWYDWISDCIKNGVVGAHVGLSPVSKLKLTVTGIRPICKKMGIELTDMFDSLPIGSTLYLKREKKDDNRFPGSISVEDFMAKQIGSIATEEIHKIELAIPEGGRMNCVITGKSLDDKIMFVEAENSVGINKPCIRELKRNEGEIIFDKTIYDEDIRDKTQMLLHLLKSNDSDEAQILALAQEYAKICCTTLDGDTFYSVHEILNLLQELKERNPAFNAVCSEIYENKKDLKRYPDDVKTKVYREQYNGILESANKKTDCGLSQMDMYINSLKFENGGILTKEILRDEATKLYNLLKIELLSKDIRSIYSDSEFAKAVFYYRYSLSSMYVLYTRRIKWEYLMKLLHEFDEATPEEDKDVILDGEKELCVSLNRSQRQMFDKAEKAGIIKYNAERKGYDKGEHSSKALVSYFCARLFCGDDTDNGLWNQGSRFDEVQYINKLFAFDVGATRRKTIGTGNGKSPKGYERVDKLFKKK